MRKYLRPLTAAMLNFAYFPPVLSTPTPSVWLTDTAAILKAADGK